MRWGCAPRGPTGLAVCDDRRALSPGDAQSTALDPSWTMLEPDGIHRHKASYMNGLRFGELSSAHPTKALFRIASRPSEARWRKRPSKNMPLCANHCHSVRHILFPDRHLRRHPMVTGFEAGPFCFFSLFRTSCFERGSLLRWSTQHTMRRGNQVVGIVFGNTGALSYQATVSTDVLPAKVESRRGRGGA
jgi:hypothetical protein